MDLDAQEQHQLAEAQRDPRKQLGPYLLLEELGRGGMGVVFKGFDPRVGRRVAIKLLLDPNAQQLVSRFQREAQLASRLQHSGVAQVFELNTTNPSAPFLVLQYVPGTTLRDRIRAGTGRLDRETIARWGAEVAEAIAVAHAAGVLHRDLKPANVMITPDDRAVVLDFGLAKSESDPHGLTRTGELVGTVNYMAPEQATDEHTVSTSVDVYGLGGILYECLTGQAPYVGQTQVNVLSSLINRPPHPPSQVVDDVDPALEAICLRCLDRDPGRRYADATAVAEALRDLITHGAAPKPERTSSAPLILLGLGALGLVGGLGLLAFASRRTDSTPEALASRTALPTPAETPTPSATAATPSTPSPTPSATSATPTPSATSATPTPSATSATPTPMPTSSGTASSTSGPRTEKSAVKEAHEAVRRLRRAVIEAAKQPLDQPAKVRDAEERVRDARRALDDAAARAPSRVDLQGLQIAASLRQFELRDTIRRARALLRVDPGNVMAKSALIVAITERAVLFKQSLAEESVVLERERAEALAIEQTLPKQKSYAVKVSRSVLRQRLSEAQAIVRAKHRRHSSRDSFYWKALLLLAGKTTPWAEVERCVRVVFKTFPRDPRMAMVGLVAALRRRKSEAVIRSFIDRTGLGPHNAFALASLATRDRKRAKTLLAEAEAHLPRSPIVPYVRGYLRFRTDPAGAIPEFSLALERDPQHYTSRSLRAACYLASEQGARAEADYRAAVKLRPNSPQPYHIVATAIKSSGVESAYSNEAVKTVTSD